MIGIRSASIGTLLMLCSGAFAPALGSMQVDDFEGVPDGGFNNPFFNHEILESEMNGQGPAFEFTDTEWISSSHSLKLAPATDYVTFNLNEGEIVDYVEVWMRGSFHMPFPSEDIRGDPVYPAQFRVLGLDASGAPLDVIYNHPDTNEGWLFYNTAGEGFAEITEIRLSTRKTGTFDDLGVNVVPEPATLGLLALGLVGMVHWRSQKGQGPRHL